MSFQENKFPIILGSVTAVAAGALIWLSIGKGGEYNEAKERYDSAVSDIERMKRAAVSPTEDNRRDKTKAVKEYKASVEELQKAFDPYRKPELENTGVSVFTDALLAARKRIGVEFDKSGTELPDQFFFGLGKFTDKLPKRESTGVLHYQLGFLEDLFGRLATAAPSQLLNAHWPDIPEEKGQVFDYEGKSYRKHPIELTFRGREDSLRAFLTALDDSEKYFYVIRSMRVSNTRSTAPNAKDASFEQPTPMVSEDDDSGFGSFFLPDDEEEGAEDEEGEDTAEEEAEEAVEAPVAEEPTDSGQILKEVLGSEEIEVFMRIEVLQFLAPEELPKG